MRRAVYRKTTTGMSLFPFLAVLICTMGSLIVLLVMVLQQARVQAAATPLPVMTATGDPEAEKKLREAKEDLDWRREVLEKQRADQSEELSKSRLELSHLEDHIRRLQEQWKQIEAKVNELKKLGDSQSQDQTALKEELERVKAQLEEAKRQLEEAKQKIKDKPRSFAIIPYQGPHGTKRRPIYIECAEEGIILHPESIVFQPADFQGPLGSGNPLDAALRTVREYLAKHGDAKKDGEPYPLLLVRPNGAVAYSMARAAMRTWDDEFGYELIDDKMELKFPPADPDLEALLVRTINDARARQIALAAAMPARYKGEGSAGFVAGPNGGFTPALIDDDEPVTSMRGGSGGAGGRGTGGGVGSGSASGSNTGGTGGGRDARNGFVPGRGGIGSGTGGQFGSGTGPYGSGGGTGGNAGTGFQAPGPNRTGGSGFEENGTLAGGQGPGGTGTGGANGQGIGGQGASVQRSGGQGSGGQGTANNGAQGFAQNGGAQGPGGSNSAAAYGGNGASGGSGAGSPGGSAAGPASPGMNGAAGGGASSGSASNSSSGSPSGSTGQAGGSPSVSTSLAKSKGRDWALPNKVAYSTGITRPIRVQCFPDRLVILSERGEAQRPKTVMFKDGAVRPVTEEFVSGIWKHMESWGLAVAGGYWKPVLRVEVAPGAEQHFAELEALLQGSGLDVQRK